MTRALEKSFGVIPLRKERGEWQVLLVKHRKGHWAFPKGHSEEGEKSQETALRELNEETGLYVVAILDPIPLQENYIYRKEDTIIYKLVDYFLATVEGIVKIDGKEIEDAVWLSLSEAETQMTFKEGKKLFSMIQTRLLGV